MSCRYAIFYIQSSKCTGDKSTLKGGNSSNSAVTHDYYGNFREFKVDDNLAALSNSNAAVQKILTEKRKAILLTVTVFAWIFAMLGNKFERATY